MKKTFRVKIEREADGASSAIGPRRRIVDELQHVRPCALRAPRSKTIRSTLSSTLHVEATRRIYCAQYWWASVRCVNRAFGVSSKQELGDVAGVMEASVARTGARPSDLIKRQCVQLIRTYRARGRLVADVDASKLSDLIVGVATTSFARFVYAPCGTIDDLLRIGLPHVALQGASLRCTIGAEAAGTNGVNSKFGLRRLVRPFTLKPPASRCMGADSRRRAFGCDY